MLTAHLLEKHFSPLRKSLVPSRRHSACYFKQARYGKFIRMALMMKLLGVEA